VVTARVLAVGAIPCPGYNTPIQLDLEHRPELSPGCANAVNLGLMVANPQDLQGTNTLAPADGAAVLPSIDRYRTGQVYPNSNSSSTVPFRTETSTAQ
jgi:pilus assembly protein CpaD